MISCTKFEEHKLKLLAMHNKTMLEVHGQIINKLFKRCSIWVGSKPYDIS